MGPWQSTTHDGKGFILTYTLTLVGQCDWSEQHSRKRPHCFLCCMFLLSCTQSHILKYTQRIQRSCSFLVIISLPFSSCHHMLLCAVVASVSYSQTTLNNVNDEPNIFASMLTLPHDSKATHNEREQKYPQNPTRTIYLRRPRPLRCWRAWPWRASRAAARATGVGRSRAVTVTYSVAYTTWSFLSLPP